MLNVLILAWMSVVAAILHIGGACPSWRVLHLFVQLSLLLAAWAEAGGLRGRWYALTGWSRILSAMLFVFYLLAAHLGR